MSQYPEPDPLMTKRLDEMSMGIGYAIQSILRQTQWLLTTRRKVYAAEATARVLAEGRTPRMPIEFRSQMGEDIILWDLFPGQTQGFYIEVGAFDGYNYSVSYAFDAMGWNGLLIEPLPARYEACKARRPHARVVNAALSCRGSSGTTTFDFTEDAYGGMFSHISDSPWELQQQKDPAAAPILQSITVPLTTMDALLAEHTGPIDFASIDVEGHEEMLLDGFNLDRFRPRALLVEDNSGGKNLAMQQMLARRGYALVGVHEIDVLFVREDDPELLRHARSIF